MADKVNKLGLMIGHILQYISITTIILKVVNKYHTIPFINNYLLAILKFIKV